MQSVPDNVAVAQNAGYEVLATRTLPSHAWVDDYYEILMPRARALLEIDVFNGSDDSYGYVFYVLRRVASA